jgi:hypothetical protein
MGAKCVVLVIKKLGICKYPHICNEVDVRQNMKKTTNFFLWFGNEVFYQNFELFVTCEWVHTCNDLDSGQIITYFNMCKMHYIGNKNN